jgi:hypothetical protein
MASTEADARRPACCCREWRQLTPTPDALPAAVAKSVNRRRRPACFFFSLLQQIKASKLKIANWK